MTKFVKLTQCLFLLDEVPENKIAEVVIYLNSDKINYFMKDGEMTVIFLDFTDDSGTGLDGDKHICVAEPPEQILALINETK